MAIANAVQATAPSDRPIKCPLCQSIIKHARNLRRHVFKRHLPAAQRGEITEADVKNVLEKKLKTITVTPLTDEELRQVQQRTRRKGGKTPRKLKGVAALPSDVNASNINESEITIRKLPQKKKKEISSIISILESTSTTRAILSESNPSNHEDILQEALAARDKESHQEEVMDLANPQQQTLTPISVVVQGDTSHPVPLTVTQSTTSTGLPLHRELTAMSAMTFEPQVSISETYHPTISQSSTSPSSPSSYIPSAYWSAPATSFQPHQATVFSPSHAEYFTTSMHMVRPAPQHRRKPYQ